uniref:(northern house mosquito) hypothetical protein n=1 Tax=Culex pipiens TaxID=7175 RepID=A0A8D8BM60_CULPI
MVGQIAGAGTFVFGVVGNRVHVAQVQVLLHELVVLRLELGLFLQLLLQPPESADSVRLRRADHLLEVGVFRQLDHVPSALVARNRLLEVGFALVLVDGVVGTADLFESPESLQHLVHGFDCRHMTSHCRLLLRFVADLN